MDEQILIVFDVNISETVGHQMTIKFPTSPKVCSCSTWRKQNQQNITFFTQNGIIT